MPHRDDRTYYRSRARQERSIAATCEDNSAALAHLAMANEYERRAARGSASPSVEAFPARALQY
jgi:hypothetical protein